jgi:hypothetical protein
MQCSFLFMILSIFGLLYAWTLLDGGHSSLPPCFQGVVEEGFDHVKVLLGSTQQGCKEKRIGHKHGKETMPLLSRGWKACLKLD